MHEKGNETHIVVKVSPAQTLYSTFTKEQDDSIVREASGKSRRILKTLLQSIVDISCNICLADVGAGNVIIDETVCVSSILVSNTNIYDRLREVVANFELGNINTDWEDIKDVPTARLREELLSLLNEELAYAAPSLNEAVSLPKQTVPKFWTEAFAADSSDIGYEIASRSDICKWNYEIVDHFRFNREVAYLSMNYFDRFLARQSDRPSVVSIHLVALSSLYVACKLGNSRESRSIHLEDLCNMVGGLYGRQMLEEMEMLLLTSLQWRLYPPSPKEFLIRYIEILSHSLNDDQRDEFNKNGMDNDNNDWSVFQLARYQIELAVYSHKLSRECLSSKLALASILNAMDSKIAGTKHTIISPRICRSFLERMSCLGNDFADLNVIGDDMVEVRTALMELCPRRIVLTGETVVDMPSAIWIDKQQFTLILLSNK